MTNPPAEAARACHHCGNPDNFPDDPQSELRPYGPGGEWVCYGCTFNSDHPEREQQAEAAFVTLLDASKTISPSGIAAIGGATGPVPSPPAECPKSKRVDRPGDHSWRFMGDDPYTECVYCGEIRDALTERIVRAGRRHPPITPEGLTNE